MQNVFQCEQSRFLCLLALLSAVSFIFSCFKKYFNQGLNKEFNQLQKKFSRTGMRQQAPLKH